MNIFVIVIEIYVNLKKNLPNWIKPNIINFTFILESRMFDEACLLTGTSHYILVIGISISCELH